MALLTVNGELSSGPHELLMPRRWCGRGFTLIELLVALAIVALLLSLAAPRYFGSIERAKETVLKANLHQMRDAIDKYYEDHARYPSNIDELASAKYLRRIPTDPIVESSAAWVIVAPADPSQGSVFDVRSSAPGHGRDGTPYAGW